MSEDKVFQRKITEQGYRIVFQDKSRDAHTHTYDISSLAKRSQNEGLGWRNVGNIYTYSDMIADMADKDIWLTWKSGVAKSEIRLAAELLFPIVRPLFLFIGNRFTNSYVK